MDILTRSGSLRASINPSDSSKCIRSVMQAGRLELHFSSSKPIPFALGDYADFEGDRYTLCYPSEVSKVQREWLEYTLVLHSSAEELKQRLVKSPEGETKVDFVMVGSPTDHLRLITRAMGEGWSVGTSLEAGDRLVAYKSDTCYAALCRLAEEYKTEWVVKGKTISLRREELWRDAPVAMSYGRGKGFLSGVSRSGDGDKLPISRLYVVGGSRNIDPAAYGSRSLHLPDGSTALSSGVEGREAALDLSHIYPSRVGTVSEVVTVDEAKCFYDIKDASIPAELNYSDCRIPGEKAVIRFQSGALAGRELEIRQSETALEGYHHEERRFELVPREEDGFTFPSPQWMPKAGDKYAVFGISLPPTYVKEAEERMLSEAKRYLEDNMEPVYTFRGEVDGIWARKHWLEVGGKLVPGGHVLFSDPEFHPSGSVIRIVSTTQAVNDPHAPSITLSTAPVPGSILSRLDRVEADEVVRREQIREVQRQQSQSYRQALEHLSMVDRAVEGLEGFTRRLKPSVIETMGILVGSQATQLDFVRAVGSLESVTPAVNFDPDDKALHIGESVLRHQTIGITTMRDRRDPSEYRYWRLPEYVSPPLTDPDRSYYIYARAARVGTEGAFLLSEEPIPMESDPDYFHLLIGTLSSIDGGDRAYNRLYGFSMISPGQMVVDTISSANGRMTIDLAQGEIYASSVSFSRPDGARGNLADLAGEVDELQSHPPKIVDGKWHVWDGKAQTYVNTGDTARGETGANGLAPKILDGKWSVWDGTRWVSTGVPARGPKGEQGAPGKDVDPKVLNDLKAAVDDARRKLDDTVTKAELDGVVSAQEKKDIQAAKAALDAAKKAYDDAVKRAKELDGEIQVGGRNLAIMSRMIPGYLYGDTKKGNPGDKDYKVIQYKDFIYDPTYYEWEGATPLTFKLHKGGVSAPIIHYHDNDKVFIGWSFDWTERPAGYTRTLTPPAKTAYIRIGFPCADPIVKLERGTVATDWTPAPEDLQVAMEEVAQAKAELAETKSKAYADGKITATEQLAIDKAQAAYDNAIRKAKELDDDFQARMNRHMQQVGQYVAMAQQEAGAARQQTEELHQYVDGAYKDGIITEVESKAIATYINEVEAMWSSAFGAYERVYSNALLTGASKTALGDAKITLAGAKDNLVNQIKTAISDGKATKAEATETERLYNVYKGALQGFQKALKVAEESIRKKGSVPVDYSTGKMLRKDPTFVSSCNECYKYDNNGSPHAKLERIKAPKDCPTTSDYALRYTYDGGTDIKPYPALGGFLQYTESRPNAVFVHRFIAKVPEGVMVIRASNETGNGTEVTWLTERNGTGKYEEYAYMHRCGATGTFSSFGHVYFSGDVRSLEVIIASSTVYDMTDASDIWPELERERTAREQAVREIATGLTSANTLIRSLEQAQDLKLDRDEMPEIGYLLAALRKPKGTQVAGGLLLSNQIILSDAEDDIISATLSGQRAKGAKSLRLGIDYTDGKDAGTEQTALCNDGTGHLGELYFGGDEISFGSDPTKRYMQIGGGAKSESEMVSASTKPGVFSLSGCSSSVSGPIVIDRFVSDFAGQEVRYTATLTASAKAFATLVRGPRNRHGGTQDTTGQDVYIGQTAESRGFLRLTISRGGSIVRTIDSVSVSATATAHGGTVPSGQLLPFGSDTRADRDTMEVTLSLPGDTIRRGDSISLVLVTTVYHRPLGSYAGMDDYPEGYAYGHYCDVSKVLCRRPIDTSRPMVSVTKDRAAFFYGRSSYILLNYLRDCVMKVVGNMIIQGNLTVKGDLKTEGGGFLAGGVISTEGYMKRWVGKRLSVRKISTGRYRITHNIGHTNYCIQAIPVNDTDWNAFVINGTETTYDVEIGVQWNGGWRNGAIHFAIFAQ